MNECWNSIKINEIGVAVYVTAGVGKVVHQNRPYQGIVLNESVGVKEYYFDDGRMMRTGPNALFYLPKGSSYYVKTIELGGCYAINFEADMIDEPFVVELRQNERLLHHFKVAANAWKTNQSFARNAAMRALYDAIYQMQKKSARAYVPHERFLLLAPALDALKSDFTQNDLTVARLAQLCGISEVYFRRLFLNLHGISPKEYMIQRRMEYAKTLLESASFSVSEIAVMCGYAEPCHFSREFLHRFGLSPSQYIKTK